MRHSKLLLVVLVWWGCVRAGRSFLHQRDVSEHCRRRALPSVFLGKRVVETNAQMMHFSRLELPYNCFIAVRAETGNHIILVIQLLSDDSLVSCCKGEGDQLLVYELGETFGGYWGQVPLDYMRRHSTEARLPVPGQTPPRNYYTLKSTHKTVTTTPTTEPTTIAEPNTEQRLSGELDTQPAVWTDVVPLLNLSLQLMPSDTAVKHRINSDDAFDAFYDVTPVPGIEYETSIVPLMQFSIASLEDTRRNGSGGDGSPLFDLIYSDEMVTSTPETRVSPHNFRNMLRHKVTEKMDYFRTMTRRYILKSTAQRIKVNKSTFGSSTSQSHQSRIVSNTLASRFQYNQNQLSNNDLSTETIPQDSWLHVLDLMNILKNTTNTFHQRLSETNDKQSKLLQQISQMEHSKSVYLEPDLNKYIENSKRTTKQNLNNTEKPNDLLKSSEIQSQILSSTEKYSFISISEVEDSSSALSSIVSSTDSLKTMTSNDVTNFLFNETSSSVVYLNTTATTIKRNDTNTTADSTGVSFTKTVSKSTPSATSPTVTTKLSSSARTTPLKPITGALVGHESWDNVVNVAPKMVVVLNNTIESSIYNKMGRKKRGVQAIDVHKSKPHAAVQRLATTTAPAARYFSNDMYGFSQIVEPRDDEIYGRAHLRYMRRFIGPPLFNLCNYTKDEPKMRQVLLFNSSRILIGISNFTIKRMTIVATSARTLESVTARCPVHHLECQVSGARVCIDSSSACDGVPNCGTYDIYDEDRLTCGAGRPFQINIYIAAFTFLAVLMTVCYSVHYWLKRCVPQVSEAFFVYTNGAENILYLDSIMKSPMDTDDLSKMFYQGPILEDGYLREEECTDRRSTLRKLMDRISIFFQRKHEVASDSAKRESRYESKRMYSFTELELNKFSFKITTDSSMQTGESLEEQKTSTSVTQDVMVERPPRTIKGRNFQEMPEETATMEPKSDLYAIKLLKFMREARGSLQESSGASGAGRADTTASAAARTSEERELRNLLYDLPCSVKESFSSLAVAYDPSDIVAPIQALTDAGTTRRTQKRLRFEEAATVIPSTNYATNDPSQSKQSLVPSSRDLGPSDEGSGMDFMRFWNIKPKKPKNKGHISLREK